MDLQPNRKKPLNSKLKILFFILQVCFVVVLLILWFSCESFQKSKSLWVLFFYSFPSEFLIAIVPHEPILLYFGKFYTPLTIAFVAVAGTVLTEILNYSVFKFITDLKLFEKIKHKKAVNKIITLFYKAPFLALWIAGFTPVPFYPFRFLVVMARYPLPKYILAVFLSRTPRFFILGWFGHAVKIPDSMLIGLFVVLIISINVPLIRTILKKRKQKQNKLS